MSTDDAPKGGGGGDTPTEENVTHTETSLSKPVISFREEFIRQQGQVGKDLKAVYDDQKMRDHNQGLMARAVALLAEDTARLHDHFKTKSVSRVIAKEMDEMAVSLGQSPIDINTYAITKAGLEGAVTTTSASSQKTTKTAKGPVATKRKNDGGTSGQSSSKKSKSSADEQSSKSTFEDAATVDEDGWQLPTGHISQENRILIQKWGIRGTGIKGHQGTMIRLPPDGKLEIAPLAKKAAKSAAADASSKEARTTTCEGFGSTLFKYVEKCVLELIDKKKANSPFRFEPLVLPGDLVKEGITNARELNQRQCSLWSSMFKGALVAMDMQNATEEVKLDGLVIAITKMQEFLKGLKKPPRNPVNVETSAKKETPVASDDF